MSRAAFIAVAFAVALSFTSAEFYETTGSDPAQAYQSWHRQDAEDASIPMNEVAETSGSEVHVAMALMRSSAEDSLMQDGTSFHINKKDRGHMSKKMKREERTNAFAPMVTRSTCMIR